jgi:Zn-dependent peptidase ImmA (M78 family)
MLQGGDLGGTNPAQRRLEPAHFSSQNRAMMPSVLSDQPAPEASQRSRTTLGTRLSVAVFRLAEMRVQNEAARDAERLLEEAWDGVTLPIDPVRIAKKLGITVLNVLLKENVSGALVKKSGRDPSIVLNAEDSKNRKRFTCAHELGHFVKRFEEPDAYEYVDYRNALSSTGLSEDERYANAFAASLLMPRDRVSELHDEGLGEVQMALRFGVSREAMQYRLSNLGLLD